MLWICTLANGVAAWPWPMVSALIGATALVIIVYVNILRPMLRRRQLRHPVRASFLIPASGRPCDYAEQDNEEHQIAEIVLPARHTVNIDLVLMAKLHFKTTSISFGCLGQPGRPKAVRYFNKFVAIGKGQDITPGPDTNDYIDVHGHYHAPGQRSWSHGTIRALAFDVATEEAGSFPVQLCFYGDEVVGTADLAIRVEDSPRAHMICVSPSHRGRKCQDRPQGIRPLGRA